MFDPDTLLLQPLRAGLAPPPTLAARSAGPASAAAAQQLVAGLTAEDLAGWDDWDDDWGEAAAGGGPTGSPTGADAALCAAAGQHGGANLCGGQHAMQQHRRQQGQEQDEVAVEWDELPAPPAVEEDWEAPAQELKAAAVASPAAGVRFQEEVVQVCFDYYDDGGEWEEEQAVSEPAQAVSQAARQAAGGAAAACGSGWFWQQEEQHAPDEHCSWGVEQAQQQVPAAAGGPADVWAEFGAPPGDSSCAQAAAAAAPQAAVSNEDVTWGHEAGEGTGGSAQAGLPPPAPIYSAVERRRLLGRRTPGLLWRLSMAAMRQALPPWQLAAARHAAPWMPAAALQWPLLPAQTLSP